MAKAIEAVFIQKVCTSSPSTVFISKVCRGDRGCFSYPRIVHQGHRGCLHTKRFVYQAHKLFSYLRFVEAIEAVFHIQGFTKSLVHQGQIGCLHAQGLFIMAIETVPIPEICSPKPHNRDCFHIKD